MTEQFLDRAVSYQQFSENPSIIDDPNLVVKVGNKYVLIFLQVFRFMGVFTRLTLSLCFIWVNMNTDVLKNNLRLFF